MELLYEATDSVRDGMPYSSVVVACRSEGELSGPCGGAFPLAEKPISYSGSEISNGDLPRLANELRKPVLALEICPLNATQVAMRESDILWGVRIEKARTVEDILARRIHALFLSSVTASYIPQEGII